LRKTYGRLHAEGHVDNKAAILVRAGEKLASENKILRQENEGLRGAIFEEKRKRKRGKALDFHEEGEQAGQALFFSPAKVTRARERAAALKEAELQRQRTAADKKLQQAIAREEKAREAIEKKARKEAERTAAREELAREKAARQAEKEAKKAQKAREEELRKIEIEKKRIKRMQAKKSSSQKAKVGEKRSINDDKVDGPRKRVRFVRSHLRNQPLTIKSTSQLDSTVIEHSNDTNGDTITATDELQLQDATRWSNSLPLRSGRHTRPPARFR
jgi:membrane protein involved in colicin uptake